MQNHRPIKSFRRNIQNNLLFLLNFELIFEIHYCQIYKTIFKSEYQQMELN
jgi:hypothetical protein